MIAEIHKAIDGTTIIIFAPDSLINETMNSMKKARGVESYNDLGEVITSFNIDPTRTGILSEFLS